MFSERIFCLKCAIELNNIVYIRLLDINIYSCQTPPCPPEIGGCSDTILILEYRIGGWDWWLNRDRHEYSSTGLPRARRRRGAAEAGLGADRHALQNTEFPPETSVL